MNGTMDIAVQKKPRTVEMIKMRYPEPYSQCVIDQCAKKLANKNASENHSRPRSTAWPYDRNKNNSIRRANNKPELPRADNLTASSMPFKPIPKTNSERKSIWTMRSIHRQPTRKLSTALSFPFSGGARQPSRQRIRGRGPTAPHLKYGIFRTFMKDLVNKSHVKKKPERPKSGLRAENNGPEKNRMEDEVSLSLPEPKSWISTLESCSKNNKKKKSKKGQESSATFVYRVADPRPTRQLTVSPPTHVDIKPRRMPSLYSTRSQPQNSGGVMILTKSKHTQSANPLEKNNSPAKKMK